jgi:hypothetical protein
MIGKIRDAGKKEPLACLKPQLQELSDINDYSKNFHHDQNPYADSHPITDAELKAYVDRTLRVIGGVLQAGTAGSSR